MKSNVSNAPACIIMAAGKGTRMKDPTRAKVMYEVNSKPLLHYVIELAYKLNAEKIIAVIGHQKELVETYLKVSHPDVAYAVQEPQLGTGHAVLQAESHLINFEGNVLVLSGDVPLLTVETMNGLIEHHHKTGAVATILTADFEDPTGYGRIIRNPDSSVNRIVEHRDASPEELARNEINSGIYIFDCGRLFEALHQIRPENAQKEYYLTDVFGIFWRKGFLVQALKTSNIDEIHGINTVAQLERIKELMEKV